LPAYRQIDCVEEVLLIASDGRYAELHRRAGTQWLAGIVRGRSGVLALATAAIEISMSELYDGLALEDDSEP